MIASIEHVEDENQLKMFVEIELTSRTLAKYIYKTNIGKEKSQNVIKQEIKPTFLMKVHLKVHLKIKVFSNLGFNKKIHTK